MFETKFPYNGYVELLSNKFISRLDDILPDYNFDYGIEFEIAICEILRDFLPEKYGVCRGHIVDFNGDNVGDDIIIYDKQIFPTIKIHAKDQFARKENIPIEAVYAYFEVKHRLTEISFKKALKQIRNVKRFVSKRKKVQYEKFDLTVNDNSNFPTYQNPIYCGIISRFSNFSYTDLEDIVEKCYKKKDKYNPEIIVFSNKLYLQIGYEQNIKNFKPTHFLMENKSHKYLAIGTIKEITFGLLLIGLISAIDKIKLGRINWNNILNFYVTKRAQVIRSK